MDVQDRPAKKAKKKSVSIARPKKKTKLHPFVSIRNKSKVPKLQYSFNTNQSLNLPDSFYDSSSLARFASLFSYSRKQNAFLLESISDYRRNLSKSSTFSFDTAKPEAKDRALFCPSEKEIQSFLFKRSKIVGILRRFLHRCRVHQLRPVNTEDIVTFDIPKNSVGIVDWSSRQLYSFEATTIYRDILNRLLHHDGVFEDPQEPRNPLTNLPLTLSQNISVWLQISNYPLVVGSAFGEYRKVRWNMDRFCEVYKIPLQIHALKQTMNDTTHYDYKERMIDFIQYVYDQEGIDCYVQSFLHTLKKYPDHSLLKLWANACVKFYEAAILHGGNVNKCRQLQTAVLDTLVPILERQKELQLLRNADLRVFQQQAPRILPRTRFPLPPLPSPPFTARPAPPPLTIQLPVPAVSLPVPSLPVPPAPIVRRIEDVLDLSVAALGITEFLNSLLEENEE